MRYTFSCLCKVMSLHRGCSSFIYYKLGLQTICIWMFNLFQGLGHFSVLFEHIPPPNPTPPTPTPNKKNPKNLELYTDANKQNALTLEHLSIHYPSEHWIHVYSHGSSQDAVCNGGAGVYIQYPDGTTKSLSAPTDQLSINFEQQAATQAMSHLINQAISNTNVFLIDCKSVLQSVQNESQDNATRNFKHQFSIISRTNNAALQWNHRKRVCRQTSQTNI